MEREASTRQVSLKGIWAEAFFLGLHSFAIFLNPMMSFLWLFSVLYQVDVVCFYQLPELLLTLPVLT